MPGPSVRAIGLVGDTMRVRAKLSFKSFDLSFFIITIFILTYKFVLNEKNPLLLCDTVRLTS